MVLLLHTVRKDLVDAMYRMSYYDRNEPCAGRCGATPVVYEEEAHPSGDGRLVRGWCIACHKIKNGVISIEIRESIDQKNKMTGVILL